MKHLILLSACLLSLLTASLAHSSEGPIRCVLVPANGGNFPFIKVSGDPTDSNSDLYSIEKKTYGHVIFLLKQGHGILRLEAYRDHKFIASSLVQINNVDDKTTMNLKILDHRNKGIESFCNNLVEL
jgi:hypothetical protein